MRRSRLRKPRCSERKAPERRNSRRSNWRARATSLPAPKKPMRIGISNRRVRWLIKPTQTLSLPKQPRSNNDRPRRQRNSTRACRRFAKNRRAAHNRLNEANDMNANIVMGMGLALVLAGCASTPRPNAALESARTAVQAAEADPNVHKYAELDIAAAKKTLDVSAPAAM